MNVWWLAISSQYSSSQGRKDRKATAQGWPDLGDMAEGGRLVQIQQSQRDRGAQLLRSWPADSYEAFEEPQKARTTNNFLNFFKGMQPGDSKFSPAIQGDQS